MYINAFHEYESRTGRSECFVESLVIFQDATHNASSDRWPDDQIVERIVDTEVEAPHRSKAEPQDSPSEAILSQ